MLSSVAAEIWFLLHTKKQPELLLLSVKGDVGKDSIFRLKIHCLRQYLRPLGYERVVMRYASCNNQRYYGLIARLRGFC